MRFNKIFYWSEEDHSYVVEVPSLPGCMSDGQTIGESLANADIIIREWIEFANELRKPVPPEDDASVQSSNPTVLDLASYIVNKLGSMSAMKLEKLTYYCQAWFLGWYHQPLVQCSFEDWANGPVNRELFSTHQGKYNVSPHTYPLAHTFTLSEQKVIDSVLSVYGDKTADWLSAQTHRELPWRQTRGSKTSGSRDNAVILDSSMIDYYSGRSTHF